MAIPALRQIVHFCEHRSGTLCQFGGHRLYLTAAEFLGGYQKIVAAYITAKNILSAALAESRHGNTSAAQQLGKAALGFDKLLGNSGFVFELKNDRRCLFKGYLYYEPHLAGGRVVLFVMITLELLESPGRFGYSERRKQFRKLFGCKCKH